MCATLAAICLLGAGVAFGVTRYRQSELERAATRDARKLAVDVLQPMLTPADVEDPIRGTRYDELLASVHEVVLAGPINGLRLWRADGTILFADEPNFVGRRFPDMREDVHAVMGGTTQSEVDGDRFRTLTSLRVGEDPPVVVAVELDQPHGAIVERAKDPWYPWVFRAGTAAAVCIVLYVATALFFALLGAQSRRATQRKEPAGATKRSPVRAPGSRTTDADLPAYMQPGFREEVEARRRAEEALAQADQERVALRARLSRLEAELDEARGRITEQEPSERALPSR